MFAKLSRGIVVLALCCSIGGHWLVLQSVAWATMLVDYSQHCSIKQAIVQTFDGAHPCDMCKQISKSKASEKNRDNVQAPAKPDLICVAKKIALLPRFVPFNYPGLINFFTATIAEPESPPPRPALS
jgi:hypothetical protein